MSIFGRIMGAIFGGTANAAPSEASGFNPTDTTSNKKGGETVTKGASASKPISTSNPVEVALILDAVVKAKGEKLEWRT